MNSIRLYLLNADELEKHTPIILLGAPIRARCKGVYRRSCLGWAIYTNIELRGRYVLVEPDNGARGPVLPPLQQQVPGIIGVGAPATHYQAVDGGDDEKVEESLRGEREQRKQREQKEPINENDFEPNGW